MIESGNYPTGSWANFFINNKNLLIVFLVNPSKIHIHNNISRAGYTKKLAHPGSLF